MDGANEEAKDNKFILNDYIYNNRDINVNKQYLISRSQEVVVGNK